jgi:hypothetical protein
MASKTTRVLGKNSVGHTDAIDINDVFTHDDMSGLAYVNDVKYNLSGDVVSLVVTNKDFVEGTENAVHFPIKTTGHALALAYDEGGKTLTVGDSAVKVWRVELDAPDGTSLNADWTFTLDYAAQQLQANDILLLGAAVPNALALVTAVDDPLECVLLSRAAAVRGSLLEFERRLDFAPAPGDPERYLYVNKELHEAYYYSGSQFVKIIDQEATNRPGVLNGVFDTYATFAASAAFVNGVIGDWVTIVRGGGEPPNVERLPSDYSSIWTCTALDTWTRQSAWKRNGGNLAGTFISENDIPDAANFLLNDYLFLAYTGTRLNAGIYVIEEELLNQKQWVFQRALPFLSLDNVTDSLTSNSSTNALSANQGRILDNKIGSLQGATRDRGVVLFASHGTGPLWTTVRLVQITIPGTGYTALDKLAWASPDDSQVIAPEYTVTSVDASGAITGIDVTTVPGAWSSEFPYATIPLAGGTGTGADITVELDNTGFYTVKNPQITVGGQDYKLGDAVTLNVPKGTAEDAIYIVSGVDEYGEITALIPAKGRTGDFTLWPADNKFTVYSGSGHGAEVTAAPAVATGSTLADIPDPRISDVATVLLDETHEGSRYTWIYADYNGDNIPNWVPLSGSGFGRDFVKEPIAHEELGAQSVSSNNIQDHSLELRHIADTALGTAGRYRGLVIHSTSRELASDTPYLVVGSVNLNGKTPPNGMYVITGLVNTEFTHSRVNTATQVVRTPNFNMVAPCYVEIQDDSAVYIIDQGVFKRHTAGSAGIASAPVRLTRVDLEYTQSPTTFDGVLVNLVPASVHVPTHAITVFNSLMEIPDPRHGEWVRVLEDDLALNTETLGPMYAQKPCTSWVYDVNYAWTSNQGALSHWRMMSVEAPPQYLGAGGQGGGRFRGVVPYGAINVALSSSAADSAGQLYLLSLGASVTAQAGAVGRYWSVATSSPVFKLFIDPGLIYVNSTTTALMIPAANLPVADNVFGFGFFNNGGGATISSTMNLVDYEAASDVAAKNMGTVDVTGVSAASKYPSLDMQRQRLTPAAIADPQPGDWCIAAMDFTGRTAYNGANPGIANCAMSVWVYSNGPGAGGYADEDTYKWKRFGAVLPQTVN